MGHRPAPAADGSLMTGISSVMGTRSAYGIVLDVSGSGGPGGPPKGAGDGVGAGVRAGGSAPSETAR